MAGLGGILQMLLGGASRGAASPAGGAQGSPNGQPAQQQPQPPQIQPAQLLALLTSLSQAGRTQAQGQPAGAQPTGNAAGVNQQSMGALLPLLLKALQGGGQGAPQQGQPAAQQGKPVASGGQQQQPAQQGPAGGILQLLQALGMQPRR